MGTGRGMICEREFAGSRREVSNMIGLRIVNVMALIGCALLLVQGFGISWELSVLPVALIMVGAVVGLVRRYGMPLVECGLMVVGGVVCVVGAALSFGGSMLMLMGASRAQIDQAAWDGDRLVLGAVMALVCMITAAVVGAVNIVKSDRRRRPGLAVMG